MTKDEVAKAADALNYYAKNMPVVPRAPWQAMLDGAEAVRQLQAENEALRKLAEHLRSCRDCGEWDVKDCSEGRPLWDAAMK
jgi:hypothetical protein